MFLTRSEYDRGVNTFRYALQSVPSLAGLWPPADPACPLRLCSPEGRLFQVEYAIEAIKVREGGPLVGRWRPAVACASCGALRLR